VVTGATQEDVITFPKGLAIHAGSALRRCNADLGIS